MTEKLTDADREALSEIYEGCEALRIIDALTAENERLLKSNQERVERLRDRADEVERLRAELSERASQGSLQDMFARLGDTEARLAEAECAYLALRADYDMVAGHNGRLRSDLASAEARLAEATALIHALLGAYHRDAAEDAARVFLASAQPAAPDDYPKAVCEGVRTEAEQAVLDAMAAVPKWALENNDSDDLYCAQEMRPPIRAELRRREGANESTREATRRDD